MAPSLDSSLDFYGQALAGAPDDKTLYANRCLARLKKEEGKEGVKEGGSGGKENSKEGGTEELLLALADAERALQVRWKEGRGLGVYLQSFHRRLTSPSLPPSIHPSLPSWILAG